MRWVWFIPASILGLAFLSGCATTPQKISLPYVLPGKPSAVPSTAQAAKITKVTDSREDRSLDNLLAEAPVDSVRKALAAELVGAGAFSQVSISDETNAPAIDIEADLHEMSWMVPNHKGMVQTAFWTSFLTGGLGGLAYGSTDTPVYGHAVVKLKLTEHATGHTILDQAFEGREEEHMAKLKCDTPNTRSQVMAAALKKALSGAAQKIASIEKAPSSTSP